MVSLPESKWILGNIQFRPGKVNATGELLELRFCCPFCANRVNKTDRNFHLSVYLTDGHYWCFRCRAFGSAFRLFRLFRLGREAVEHFCKGEDVFFARGSVDVAAVKDESIRLWHDWNRVSNQGFLQQVLNCKGSDSLLAQQIREFFWRQMGRNYSKDHYRRALLSLEVGVDIDESAIVFPFWNYRRDYFGGFTKRMLPQWRKPKYVTTVVRTGERVIFGEAAAIHSPLPVIVEGPFDALAWWPHGMALCGKNTKPVEFFVRCRENFDGVVVCLHNDARQEALELTWALYEATELPIYICSLALDSHCYDPKILRRIRQIVTASTGNGAGELGRLLGGQDVFYFRVCSLRDFACATERFLRAST